MCGERFNYLKELLDKHVTLMDNILDLYEACRHKLTFLLYLSTNYPCNG